MKSMNNINKLKIKKKNIYNNNKEIDLQFT